MLFDGKSEGLLLLEVKSIAFEKHSYYLMSVQTKSYELFSYLIFGHLCSHEKLFFYLLFKNNLNNLHNIIQ